MRRRFLSREGDHLTLLNVFRAYQDVDRKEKVNPPAAASIGWKGVGDGAGGDGGAVPGSCTTAADRDGANSSVDPCVADIKAHSGV